MSRLVLLDTGPLVAFLNRQDDYHDWAESQLSDVSPPMMTCEPVLSEACFLVRRIRGGPQRVVDLVRRQALVTPFRLDDHATRIADLLARYSDVPMSLADACLVRMSEVYTESVVMTLDSDFRVYRRNGRQVIPTIMP